MISSPVQSNSNRKITYITWSLAWHQKRISVIFRCLSLSLSFYPSLPIHLSPVEFQNYSESKQSGKFVATHIHREFGMCGQKYNTQFSWINESSHCVCVRKKKYRLSETASWNMSNNFRHRLYVSEWQGNRVRRDFYSTNSTVSECKRAPIPVWISLHFYIFSTRTFQESIKQR